MRIVTVRNYPDRELKLRKYLSHLSETSSDRNAHWFPALLKGDFYLNNDSYLDWFLLLNSDDEITAFSTIQQFYPGCFRLVTRCFLNNNLRRSYLPEHDTRVDTPASLMVNEQLKYLNYTYDTVFITLEKLNRKNTIKHMANKMTISSNIKWIAHDKMMFTCKKFEYSKDDSACWQNICFSGNPPNLKEMTHDEYRSRFIS